MQDCETSLSVPGFAELIEGFGGAEVEHHADAAYGLLPDLTLGYLNPAWFRFASKNGGRSISDRWGLGASVLDATSGPAREFYESRFRRCLDSGLPWRQGYECSSEERNRHFHMDVHPLREGSGLLVVSTSFVDRPHPKDRISMPPNEELYTNAEGLILQCSFCRRVNRPSEPGQWDWVAAWVREVPHNVTGGICQPCYQSHFRQAP